jgi:hypothetical protein
MVVQSTSAAAQTANETTEKTLKAKTFNSIEIFMCISSITMKRLCGHDRACHDPTLHKNPKRLRRRSARARGAWGATSHEPLAERVFNRVGSRVRFARASVCREGGSFSRQAGSAAPDLFIIRGERWDAKGGAEGNVESGFLARGIPVCAVKSSR